MDTGATTKAKQFLATGLTLLEQLDLLGSKQFVERAMEADPLLDGVDQVLAIVDVLLAHVRHINDRVNWYSILQLHPPSSSSPSTDADMAAIKGQYRRLALLLHPDRNKFSGAKFAFRLVADAFAVLSDPSKKSLFDAELHIANSSAAVSSSTPTPIAKEPFWTACPSCCYVHQYSREYLNQTLRCPNCRRGFRATKLPASPPIVPGTDMYYCSWGFFPLGFPGAPGIFAKGDLNAEWNPFFPVFSCSRVGEPMQTSNHHQQDMARSSSNPHGKPQNNGSNENLVEPQSTSSGTRSKTMAVKKVGRLRNSSLASENQRKSSVSVELPKVLEPWSVSEAVPTNIGGVEGRDININQKIKIGSEDGVHAADDHTINFHIDVNATDEILDNLQNLAFLRDEELHLRTNDHL